MNIIVSYAWQQNITLLSLDGLYDWVTRGTNVGYKVGLGVGPVSLDSAAGDWPMA